ncbi:DUF6602 domain-containing protein [Streptomyces roseolus]|uniref:DUF6602 domain-containing protein n=1 Tax=Streptomyces roseolus TaxID=67358 RepID=UPI00167AF6CE|nr:DUF6602 domain-containing protein [Streptomyces roseolus]GGR51981.1 hypothetical protein GCM10010282_51180 [Streptomyces roseolus]
MSTHDLEDFFEQTAARLASEYQRIRKRNDDHGTSGDEGEANWARIVLEQWLPEGYHVVTKGRILSARHRGVDPNGAPEISPQIDVLILSPFYPKFLVDNEVKTYLADGVVAAFECKNTLKAKHLAEAARTAAIVRKITAPRRGTPYRELFGTPIYGVLAHSHEWKGENSDPIRNVDNALHKGIQELSHPREMLDMVCVADLATWYPVKMPWVSRQVRSGDWSIIKKAMSMPDSYAMTHMIRDDRTAPLLSFMTSLMRRLAWEEPRLLPIAGYFHEVAPFGGTGPGRLWGEEIYSEKVRKVVTRPGWDAEERRWKTGDEWARFMA